MYKPVVYRLYYEDSHTGRRASLLALSRIGFFAVTAALADELKADKAILTIIAPLTLATIGKQKLSEVEELLSKPLELCSHIVNGLKYTVSLEREADDSKKSGNENKDVATRIINVAIQDDNDKKKIVVKRFADKEEVVVGEIASGTKIVVVKKLECDSGSSTNGSGHDLSGLPAVCHYKCKLNYEVSQQKKSIDIETYIVVVPVAMAQRLEDGTIVVFRERSPDKLDMESALRASILEGLAMSLVRAVKEHIEGEKEADITFFYDTTHGVNALLSPFSYAMNIVDQLAILRLTEKLLESHASNEDFTYKVRSYLYNSDPVQLRTRDEIEYVKVTLESNISYYYRTLIEESTLSTEWENIEGKEARERLR